MLARDEPAEELRNQASATTMLARDEPAEELRNQAQRNPAQRGT
jgi:hypothetical protein